MVLHEKSEQYLTELIADVDDLLILANTPAQTDSLLHDLEQAMRGIDFYMNSDKKKNSWVLNKMVPSLH